MLLPVCRCLLPIQACKPVSHVALQKLQQCQVPSSLPSRLDLGVCLQLSARMKQHIHPGWTHNGTDMDGIGFQYRTYRVVVELERAKRGNAMVVTDDISGEHHTGHAGLWVCRSSLDHSCC